MRPAFGLINDLRSLTGGVRVAMESGENFRKIQDLMLVTEKQFCLPETNFAMNLIRQFENGALARMIERYELSVPQLQLAMDAMTTSWLDKANERKSVDGFIALQGIGHSLSNMRPFGDRLTDALQVDLGDWSGTFVWPNDIFVDAPARTSFYVSRGLNPNLTAFPSGTFDQIVFNTGLRTPVPPVDKLHDSGTEDDEADRETAFRRTNRAHDALQRFETLLRSFIEERMQQAFGPSWVKHQVPGEMRQEWINKQQRARDNREPEQPLLDYADFTDYIGIITRRDNWRAVFEEVFLRETSVQESFQRLYPIRICTMHSRLLTRDDELYLYVETKRILDAIGIKK